MARYLQLTIAVALYVLIAGTASAQTDPVAKSRLDKQGQILTQLAKRLVALEGSVKATGSVSIADVDARIKARAVELPSVRPNGIWNRRDAEETKFRSELRTELDGYNDSIDELEYAVAYTKGGDRKDAVKRIRRNRGW